MVKPLRKHYNLINIHYTEIRSIYDLIKIKSGETTIETDNFSFTEWDEFEKHYKVLKRLVLKGTGKHYGVNCRLSIEKNSTSLDCSWGDVEKNASLFYLIDGIISSVELKRKWYYSLQLFIAACAIPLVLLLASGPLGISNITIDIIDSTVLLLLIIRGLLIPSKNKISLQYADQDTSFWHRKWEDIIINIVVAVIFFLLGLFVKL